MTLLRWFLFTICIALAGASVGQEPTTPIPDTAGVQKPATQPSLEGQKARLAVLSPISSKSPSGSSFMAKWKNQLRLRASPCSPKERW